LTYFLKDGIEKLLKEFHSGWQAALNAMKLTVIENFFNFNTGTSVFKKMLEIVFDHYSGLTKIILERFKELRLSKLILFNYFFANFFFLKVLCIGHASEVRH